MVEFRGGCIVNDTNEDLPQPPTDGWYYTQKEFAELLDVPEGTVRIWVMRGVVPCVRYYGRVYIPENVKFRYNRPWMTALRGNEMTKNW